jgi:deoxycytidylate deaminase
MLTPEEKGFYIDTAIRASELSSCSSRQGSVVVRDRKILSHGYNRKIIKDEKWEISAIYDAIFGSDKNLIENSTVFCSYFPSVADIILIVASGVVSINFVGDVNDSESVLLLNKLAAAKISLEIVAFKK